MRTTHQSPVQGGGTLHRAGRGDPPACPHPCPCLALNGPLCQHFVPLGLGRPMRAVCLGQLSAVDWIPPEVCFSSTGHASAAVSITRIRRDDHSPAQPPASQTTSSRDAATPQSRGSAQCAAIDVPVQKDSPKGRFVRWLADTNFFVSPKLDIWASQALTGTRKPAVVRSATLILLGSCIAGSCLLFVAAGCLLLLGAGLVLLLVAACCCLQLCCWLLHAAASCLFLACSLLLAAACSCLLCCSACAMVFCFPIDALVQILRDCVCQEG